MKHVLFFSLLFMFTIDISQGQTTDTIIKKLDFNEGKRVNHKPFIDKLKNGESFEINWESNGCFHSLSEKMIVSKNNGHYYAQMGKEKLALTKVGVIAVRNFEKKLNKIGSYGCTTVDNYVLIFNKKVIKVEDGSCDWNGFYNLKKVLGFKKE